MASTVTVKALDGKENTIDETRVTYQVGIPNDVIFYTEGKIVYAQFWNANATALVSIPATQLVSIW